MQLPQRSTLNSRAIVRLLVFCATVITLSACHGTSNAPANRQAGAASTRELSATSDDDLIDQVEVFSTDLGEEGQAAWKQLEAYPRRELVDRLSRIRDDSNQEDFIATNIAFVLCNLDQDYQLNRQLIVAAFNQSPDTAELYEAQIDRLIQRGDKDLLQVLFDIAPRSDGALSDGLAVTFAYQIKSNTEAFLTQLGKQPRTVRRQVSEFVNSSVSDDEKTAIKSSLKSIPESSPLSGLAKEIESDLSQSKID